MTYPNTEVGVRSMFGEMLDCPEIATVSQLDPDVWLVVFADGTQATAYPLEGRSEDDPLNEQRRAHAQGKMTESDCFGDLD